MTLSLADLNNAGSASVIALLGFRVGGLMLIAPVFSSRTIPMTMRTTLVIIVTWLLAPVALASSSVAAVTPANVISETVIGVALGLGAAMLIAGTEIMGEVVAIHTGLSGAASLDPMTFQSSPVIGQFMALFAVAILLSTDGHIHMLQATADSLQIVPVGQSVQMQAGFTAMLTAGTTMFMLGLRFAAPVIVSVLLANAGLGILTRAAPQLNILSVAHPLQIALGLAALMASLPLIATFFTGWDSVYESFAAQVFSALMGGVAR